MQKYFSFMWSCFKKTDNNSNNRSDSHIFFSLNTHNNSRFKKSFDNSEEHVKSILEGKNSYMNSISSMSEDLKKKYEFTNFKNIPHEEKISKFVINSEKLDSNMEIKNKLNSKALSFTYDEVNVMDTIMEMSEFYPDPYVTPILKVYKILKIYKKNF